MRRGFPIQLISRWTAGRPFGAQNFRVFNHHSLENQTKCEARNLENVTVAIKVGIVSGSDQEVLGDRTYKNWPRPTKVVLYRDTGSVDPGSGHVFGSVSGSEIHILGVTHAKDTFSLY